MYLTSVSGHVNHTFSIGASILLGHKHLLVLIRPNETIRAMFTMTVPADEAPDVVEFDLPSSSPKR